MTLIKNVVNNISEEFWHIIERSNGNTETLKSHLNPLPQRQLAMFYFELRTLISLIWDIFEEDLKIHRHKAQALACWVIYQGRNYYMHVLFVEHDIDELKSVNVDIFCDHMPDLLYDEKFGTDIGVPENGFWEIYLSDKNDIPYYEKLYDFSLYRDFWKRLNLPDLVQEALPNLPLPLDEEDTE